MTPGAYRRQGTRMSLETQRRVDEVIRKNSREAAARLLGVTVATLDKLASGQGVRADVVAKVEAALAVTA